MTTAAPIRNLTHRVTDRTEALCQHLAAKRDLRFELRQRWPTDALNDAFEALPGELVLRVIRGRDLGDHIVDLDGTVVWCSLDGGAVSVYVWGGSNEALATAVENVREIAPRSVQTEDELRVTFWSLGPNGPMGISRKVTAPEWDAVASNYAASTRADLERLRVMEFDPVSGGKLVLWHGDPGTGKTYALRALAREWRPWCEVHFIVDPDKFFGQEAAYLITVLLGESGPVEIVAMSPEGPPPPPLEEVTLREPELKWRLIVLEDTGELLTKDAKHRQGQALSRLLNVCDGMIGQGLRVLVLITTNEDLGALHAAVTRPGRCAANVRFDPLSAQEAHAWLAEHGQEADVDLGSRSLAELYGYLAGDEPPIQPARQAVGFAR